MVSVIESVSSNFSNKVEIFFFFSILNMIVFIFFEGNREMFVSIYYISIEVVSIKFCICIRCF